MPAQPQTLEQKQAEMRDRYVKAPRQRRLPKLVIARYHECKPTKARYAKNVPVPTPRVHPKWIGGIVYLVGCPRYRWYKIGISHGDGGQARLANLVTSVPFPLSVREVWPCQYARSIEDKVLRDYARYRVSGEWLELSPGVRDQLIVQLDADCAAYAVPDFRLTAFDYWRDYRLSGMLDEEQYSAQIDSDKKSRETEQTTLVLEDTVLDSAKIVHIPNQ